MMNQTQTLNLTRYELDALGEACEAELLSYGRTDLSDDTESIIAAAIRRSAGSELAWHVEQLIIAYKGILKARRDIADATLQGVLEGERLAADSPTGAPMARIVPQCGAGQKKAAS